MKIDFLKHFVLLILSMLLSISCANHHNAVVDTHELPPALLPGYQITMGDNNGSADTIPFSSIQEYFDFYRFEDINGTHEWDYFTTQEYDVFYHVIKPATNQEGALDQNNSPKGTVYFIHGYLDHSSLHNRVFKSLTDQGYTVAALDLPGHGFSSGERGNIPDFSIYTAVITEFIERTRTKLPAPYIGLGHSTGCSVLFEYVRQGGNHLSRLILAAPLIRSWMWGPSRFGAPLISWAVPELPRRLGGNLDTVHKEIFDNDPLYIPWVPLHWVYSLFEWNDELENWRKTYPRLSIPLKIIQGKDETVVDIAYNIPFFQDVFEDTQVHYIEKGDHLLFFAPDSIWKEVESTLLAYLAPEQVLQKTQY